MTPMFAFDQTFMFRFEADPGKPLNENHKIIPTTRALAELGKLKMQELIQRFLSRSDIKWTPCDNDTALSAVYDSVKYPNVVISPATITAHGITRKIVWVLTRQDVDEVNGFASDGNNRATALMEKRKR